MAHMYLAQLQKYLNKITTYNISYIITPLDGFSNLIIQILFQYLLQHSSSSYISFQYKNFTNFECFVKMENIAGWRKRKTTFCYNSKPKFHFLEQHVQISGQELEKDNNDNNILEKMSSNSIIHDNNNLQKPNPTSLIQPTWYECLSSRSKSIKQTIQNTRLHYDRPYLT